TPVRIAGSSGETEDSRRSDAHADKSVGAPLADRWIFSRLSKTAVAVNKALDTYQFHEAVSLLYHFFWDDFCDWYIELRKDEITAGDEEATTRIISILDTSLRMLHPFMPYLTEELWLKLPGTSSAMHNAAYGTQAASLLPDEEGRQAACVPFKTIMLADFPLGDAKLFDDAAEKEMSAVIDVIKKVRNIRA
ncbi:MAG: class I tRNA ligase family protein, partial [Blastocatellia bacterium]|nr:class I tRNA ligase family protein [Blastocatellia bacterium]